MKLSGLRWLLRLVPHCEVKVPCDAPRPGGGPPALGLTGTALMSMKSPAVGGGSECPQPGGVLALGVGLGGTGVALSLGAAVGLSVGSVVGGSLGVALSLGAA